MPVRPTSARSTVWPSAAMATRLRSAPACAADAASDDVTRTVFVY
jgi:hypothetical protein